MKNVKKIVYRYLTDVDFYNMYKPLDSEPGGGGQKYIDFPTTAIKLPDWELFFGGVIGLSQETVAAGPKWGFPLRSIGAAGLTQPFYIYQRRPNSVCVPRQHILSSSHMRVTAWRPDYGFPEPTDNNDRHQLPQGLMVYFVSTDEGEVYAGWFINDGSNPPPCQDELSQTRLAMMFANHEPGGAGVVSVKSGDVMLDENNLEATFYSISAATAKDEREIAESTVTMLLEDEIECKDAPPEVKEILVTVRVRNAKAVKLLKNLYKSKCQMTDDKFTFAKKNGEYYSEAHHLIPLGAGGFDNPRNIVILSPLIHRMLHYANVEEIDLSKAAILEDGTATLKVVINGETYTITWAPEHASYVSKADTEG